ncbi:hypothetical protein E2C01_074247 [Portunus trituberculatus]|uniref:Uncharacterized protein n=1 Tax=Portunus trituberculatus TaxID=210409 RepID=A0A5B7ICR0_PORTR|nr:hypothetical protein [Portunus trituberculatus]
MSFSNDDAESVVALLLAYRKRLDQHKPPVRSLSRIYKTDITPLSSLSLKMIQEMDRNVARVQPSIGQLLGALAAHIKELI